RIDPGQGLVQVMMGVDQAGKDDVPAVVYHFVGGVRMPGGGADRDDPPVLGVDAAIGDLPPVHGDHESGIVEEERRHGPERYPPPRVAPMTLSDRSLADWSVRLGR